MNKKMFLTGIILLFLGYGLWGCSNSKNEPSHSQSEATLSKPDSSQSYKVTFVELGSVNCIPCKMMMPIMEEIEKEYGDQVKVVFHDVWTDEGRPYAEKYGIKSIPTQVFLDARGNEFFRHTGFFPKEDIVQVLKQKGIE